MAKRKMTKGQTMIYKTKDRETQTLTKNRGWTQVHQKGRQFKNFVISDYFGTCVHMNHKK